MAKLIKVWDGSAWQTVGTASTVGVQGTTGTQGTLGTQGTTGAQGTTGTATSSSITTWVKTATGGETSLTGSSDSSTTLAYTAGQEQLFINGVLQVRGSDYTATNGTSITGLTALVAGDIATVTSVNAFSVTGAVPLSTVTANGDLIVGTSSGAVGRLGIGSTDQVLKVSGGVPVWATASAGGSNFTLLNSGGTALTGAATITISGISNKEQILIIIDSVSSVNAASFIGLRINGDTGSVYNYWGTQTLAATAYATTNFSYTGTFGADIIPFGRMSSNAASQVGASATIEGGKSTGNKLVRVTGAGTAAGGNSAQSYVLQGFYEGTATISSISIVSSTGNFDGGGMVFVYGSEN